ncbi:MAG: FAD-dependent oxidoreductase [Paracoccaceae bacterium]
MLASLSDPHLELSRLEHAHFDVAIIGAGINGSSAAQHLSAAGYKALVVEQSDFANGATSRSSRLLHCGLRHLASGHNFWQSLMRPDRLAISMKTVRDDMLARDEIVGTIPERVKPINFCLPIYSDDKYAPWQMDAAFAALRLTSPTGEPLSYKRYRPHQLDQVPVSPWLRDPDKLRSVAVFKEYLFDWPERIALDAVFAAQAMGAIVRNYTQVTRLQQGQDGSPWRITLCSTKNDTQADAGTATVTADFVLNLAGAWVDEVIAGTGSNSGPKCTGMKGIHIAVQLPAEFSDWGVFTYNSLGEPLYCLPFRGIHYIGLTRTPFSGDVAGVSATDQEIDWMVAETNRCLPKLALARRDVLFTWAGVNPLTHDPLEPLGSREIKLHDLAADGMPRMMALTGGPIMTHRRVARKITQEIRKQIAPSHVPQPVQYGGAKTVFDHSATDPAANASKPSSVLRSEIERCAQTEMPASLSDLMMRRLGLGWEPDQGKARARSVAEIAAPHLGWSAETVEDELTAYQAHLDRFRRKPGSD